MKTKVPFAFNILLNMIPIPPLFLSVCLEKLLLEYPGGDNAATNSNGVLVLIEAKFQLRHARQQVLLPLTTCMVNNTDQALTDYKLRLENCISFIGNTSLSEQ